MDTKKLINGIKDGIDDLATVEVYTFTGTLTADATDAKGIKWSELRSTLATSGDLTLVAATKVYVDLDADNYQTSIDFPDKQAMLEAHQASVKAAMDARSAVMDFAKSLLLGGS